MNNNLVNFLSGQSVIAVQSAEDMKHFVEWLNKYDMYDILVTNQLHAKDYAKISFWKDMAKQVMAKTHEWIHPAYFTIYFHFIGYTIWYYKISQVKEEFGTTSCIVKAMDL